MSGLSDHLSLDNPRLMSVRILVSLSKVQILHFAMNIYGQKLSFRNEIQLAAMSLKLTIDHT
jgi:hypothetical protein